MQEKPLINHKAFVSMSNTMLIPQWQNDSLSSSFKLAFPEARIDMDSIKDKRLSGRLLIQTMTQTIQNLRKQIQGGFQTVKGLFDVLYGEETRG
jgi:hypothetical protein